MNPTLSDAWTSGPGPDALYAQFLARSEFRALALGQVMTAETFTDRDSREDNHRGSNEPSPSRAARGQLSSIRVLLKFWVSH